MAVLSPSDYTAAKYFDNEDQGVEMAAKSQIQHALNAVDVKAKEFGQKAASAHAAGNMQLARMYEFEAQGIRIAYCPFSSDLEK